MVRVFFITNNIMIVKGGLIRSLFIFRGGGRGSDHVQNGESFFITNNIMIVKRGLIMIENNIYN